MLSIDFLIIKLQIEERKKKKNKLKYNSKKKKNWGSMDKFLA